MALPGPGIYFRKASMNDRLLDGLITLKVSVAVITPIGVEEKEIVVTGSDILEAVTALLSLIANYGGGVMVAKGSNWGVDRAISAGLITAPAQPATPPAEPA